MDKLYFTSLNPLEVPSSNRKIVYNLFLFFRRANNLPFFILRTIFIRFHLVIVSLYSIKIYITSLNSRAPLARDARELRDEILLANKHAN